MKSVISTRSQYFLIVFTYVAVWLASTINYARYGMISKIIKTTVIALLVWVTFGMLIPFYVSELLGWEFVNTTAYQWVSSYVISVPVSKYFINDQRKNNFI